MLPAELSLAGKFYVQEDQEFINRDESTVYSFKPIYTAIIRGFEQQAKPDEESKKDKTHLAGSGWFIPVQNQNVSLEKFDIDNDFLNFMSLDLPELRLVKRLSCFEQICD